MELADALIFASSSHNGVLVTLKRDGRPQLSNISHAVVDGAIGISITDGRAKTKNLRRDPRSVALRLEPRLLVLRRARRQPPS